MIRKSTVAPACRLAKAMAFGDISTTQEVTLAKNRPRKNVVVYTDGACSPNPGPGGCSAVLLYEKHRKEIAEGYRLTTNNRMELMAVVRALESLNQKCSVQIFTDSRYVRDAFERGWIKKWKSNGWKTRLREDVLNTDLWLRLCELCQVHECVFHWIKGHHRTKENIRCDELAVAAGKKPRLAIDHDYEKTRRLSQDLLLPKLPDASEARRDNEKK
jgi:ribonuclease HI